MDALPISELHATIKRQPYGGKYVKDPKTLGEYLRNRRMEMHLLQKDVAVIIGVSEDAITYWENNRSKPQIQFYPKIISFLGFNPFALDISTLGGRIRQYRYENGLSHKELSKLLNVDASTVGAWEKGESKPKATTRNAIMKLLKE
jgi:transcriptional regulator with XRE-family HTH domain